METNNLNSLLIVSEIEMVYKPKVKASQRPLIRTSSDAYKIFLHSWDMDKIELAEQFKVLLMTRANRVLGVCNISSGSVCNTVADPKSIFGAALKGNATSLIICHNHPSGSLVPSNSDREMTRRIKQCGIYLEIIVQDHLVISNEGYYSFADEGEM